jgi:PEGA domain
MRLRRFCIACAVALAIAPSSWAQDRAEGSAEDPAEGPERDRSTASVDAARQAFVDGAAHAKEMRWGDALERFEASARLKPHAGTSYNIGICHRALGRYALAQATFRRSLAEHQATGELAPSLVANTHAFLEEIDRVLASFDVTLSPPTAKIAVDGRPLEVADADAKPPTLVAGVEAPGPPEAPPSGRFKLVLDPGAHVFVLSQKGYGDVVVRRNIRPGARKRLDLSMRRLPATLSVESSEASAAVSVDGIDVGLAPVALSRPPGRYHVLVRKDGFDPYETDVLLRSAQEMDLRATLAAEEPGIHEQWWFWTSIGAALTTAAVVTYFVVRPEPQRPPLDGGGLGWTIQVP